MHQPLMPLYERFDFVALPYQLVKSELERPLSGRF